MSDEMHRSATIDDLTPSVFFTLFVRFFLAIFLFLSLLYGPKDLTVFCLSILVLAAGTALWSRLSPRAVDYRAHVSRNRVFPGESLRLTVAIENGKWLPVFVRIAVSISAFFRSGPDDALFEAQGGVLWHQSLSFSRRLTAERRGVYPIGAPSLTTGDLFGLYPTTRVLDRQIEVVVYPRIVRIQPFPLLKRIIFGKPGTASPVHDPIYFLGTRDYQGYQPSRYMDWKASARHNRLQEKIFEPVEQDKVLLVLDVDGFYDADTDDVFEQTIEAVAALIVSLDTQNYAIGFLSNACCGDRTGDDLPVQRKHGRLTALFDRLARMQNRPVAPMAAVLQGTENMPRNVSCVYFSFASEAATGYFAARHVPTVHIVCGADATGQALENRCGAQMRRIFLREILV